MEGATRTAGLVGVQRGHRYWSAAALRTWRVGAPAAPLVIVVLAGVALRFATLHVQSYDFDELQTARLMRMDFGGLLSGIAHDESTPPLYYLMAWVWSRGLGASEAGLRALSALFGVATVPVVYGAARELVRRRAALVAAALVALSPWMVWYSQEARAYALAALLAAVSFWLFAHALRHPSVRGLRWWAAASALAVCAHYFTAFVILPQAAWLLWRRRTRAPVIAPLLALALVSVALIPLAVYQRGEGHADQMVSQSGSLALRTAQLVKESLVAYDAPAKLVVTGLAAALAAMALVLLVWRGVQAERRAVLPPVLVVLAAVAVPIALALGGLDYVVGRNLIAACAPAAIVLAAGFCVARAGRWGLVGAIGLCGLFAFTTLSVVATPRFQRDDWRGAARSLGPAHDERVLVVVPWVAPQPFSPYLPSLRTLPPSGAWVREVDVVAIANTLGRAGQGRALPPATHVRPPLPAFHRVALHRGDTYLVARFRAARPVWVDSARLASANPQENVVAAHLVQSPPS